MEIDNKTIEQYLLSIIRLSNSKMLLSDIVVKGMFTDYIAISCKLNDKPYNYKLPMKIYQTSLRKEKLKRLKND
jgi:hypothetical protein